ncbi:MAG: tyrosine-type recombinase/integrase, partial [Methanoregula sp.]|nr:tyrosine-type recombinase/integrase [Methanoregula sp.]
MQDQVFHSRDGPEYAGSRLAKQLEQGRLSNKEVTLIKDFLYERKAKKNLSGGRIALYVNHLIRLKDFVPCNYDEMTTGAFMEGISKIKTGKRLNGDQLSSSTIHDYILSLKVFAEWLVKRKHSTIPMEEIKEIKVPKAPLMTKTPDDMLTEEEIQKLIGVCENSKERALIACIFDAALRIEEAGYLRWRQIQKLKHGISISTDKKTGFPRYIPCATAWTYLKTWKMDYPALFGIPPEGDNFVFLTQKGE